MNYLVVGDTHFTDNEVDSYRWRIFDTIKSIIAKYKIKRLIQVGDLVDRKDKHPSNLVNRLVDELYALQEESKVEISIISGNHDKPVDGPYFWEFLNEIGIEYITKPTYDIDCDVWLLPYTHSPIEDWKELDFSKAKAFFIHQTVSGVVVEDDRVLQTGCKLPFSDSSIVFSGDVHRPQKIGNIIYVGTPHPVKFSEVWANRVIVVKNDDFANYEDIWIDTTRRAILNIKSIEELKTLNFSSGDQVRVRFQLDSTNFSSWAVEEGIIRQWAEKAGVKLASVEATLAATNQDRSGFDTSTVEEVIRTFGKEEKLDESIVEWGVYLANTMRD